MHSEDRGVFGGMHNQYPQLLCEDMQNAVWAASTGVGLGVPSPKRLFYSVNGAGVGL